MMTQILELFKQRINLKVATSCILSLALVVTPAALADFKPPPDEKTADADTRTSSGTTRGCEGEDIPLTVLASRNNVGRTTSTHPTFAWFVPDDSKSLKLEFMIYKHGSDGNFTEEVLSMSFQSSPGIMKLSPFPEGEPGLEVGKEYLWQVVIWCDSSSPSSAVVDGANIEVVEMPPALQSKLDNAVDSAEKADLYAEAGIWYNALDEALKPAEESKLGEVAAALLEDLAKFEKPEASQELTPDEREWIEKRMEYLKEIINLSR
ncbi:MAG: DUF928 domain-containing protein [Symploca sp. SIO2G7]|nr:DUF928 domain-containing protein [Symploca sp. SIO2G7]